MTEVSMIKATCGGCFIKASDTEKGQMDAHMASCAECMEEKEEIRALEFRMRLEPKFAPTAEDLQELIDKTEKKK